MSSSGKYIFTVEFIPEGILEVQCNHPGEIVGELFPDELEPREYKFISVREVTNE